MHDNDDTHTICREEYCRRHGYHIINANSFVDRSRPAAWSKLKAIDYYLHKQIYGEKGGTSSSKDNESNTGSSDPQDHTGGRNKISGRYYDYLLYIDVDVVIMDLDRSLEEFIRASDTFIDSKISAESTSGMFTLDTAVNSTYQS